MAVQDVVVVGKRDVFTMRGIKPGVLGLGDAAILLMNHSDTVILRRKLIANLWAGVFGPVIYKNHLKIRVRLLQNRIHAIT